MKNKLLLFCIVVSVVLFSSCKDSLDPIGDYQQRYVLNCIVRGDSTFQTATLTSSYTVSDNNPYSYTDDPAVKNAVIRIWDGNDIVTFLRDTTTTEPEGSLYNRPYTVYYTDNFKPQENSTLSIEAILPNGIKLESSALVPAKITPDIENSSGQIPPKEGNKVFFQWNSSQKNPIFIVFLKIYYYRKNEKSSYYQVPRYYANYNDNDIPVYSSIQVRQ